MKKFSEYLTEAAEQLDEISKEKLGQYVKAAHRDAVNKAQTADSQEEFANKMLLPSNRDREMLKAKSSDRSRWNRHKGIDRATNKLTGRAKVPAKD